MTKINFPRLLIAAAIAGVLSFIGDGLIHGMVLKESWGHLLTALGKKPNDGGSGLGIFLAYDLLRGLAAVWIYVAIRPRFGAGPSAAVIAGLTAWFLVLPVALLGLAPMEFFPTSHLITWSALGAVLIVASTVAGAAVYKE